MSDRPVISLVVSTIGRPAELRRLLQSIPLAAQRTSIELVLVDQSEDESCREVLAQEGAGLRWHYFTSRRGLSIGRNVGIEAAQGLIIAFPDDDCWYPEGLLDDVAEAFDERTGTAILSGQQVTPDGRPSMLPFPQQAGAIHRLNAVRCAISSGLFVRAPVAKELRFDEQLGAGSAGWWGAGEETDFVLRALAGGNKIDYEPKLKIFQEDLRPADSPAYRRKMLLYGCGMGEVLRRHRFPFWYLASRVARRAIRISVELSRGHGGRAVASSLWLRGLVAGWRGIAPRELAAFRP